MTRNGDNEHALELITFQAAAGVTTEEMRVAGSAVSEVLRRWDGFLQRMLARDDDGQWIGAVLWRDRATASPSAKYRPDDGVMEWYVERAGRCIEQMWSLAGSWIAFGTDSESEGKSVESQS